MKPKIVRPQTYEDGNDLAIKGKSSIHTEGSHRTELINGQIKLKFI